MNLEQQVCSLELAKRLKELGVDNPSWFFWQLFRNDVFTVTDDPYSNTEVYHAYTVAELGEMLMDFCINNTSDIALDFNHNSNGYYTLIIPTILNKILNIYMVNHKEADVRAHAVIWLIENGHIKV